MSRIYGVEPNRDHHEKLSQRIKEAGLEDIYVIVPVGVEDLGTWKGDGDVKLKKGEVDSVFTVLVLCSIPEPKRMIRELYGYLKEGGKWIVFEHVVVKEAGLIAMYQGEFS